MDTELALVSCVRCGRTYGARYEREPPSLDEFECACGETQFEPEI